MRADALLIGGGVAAVSAAEELRAVGFSGSIVVLSRELEAPHHRPPVTKELLVGSATHEDVRIQPPEWWAAHDVELRTRTSVTALDPVARTATLATKEQIAFGQALVATGAMVRRLPLPGAQLPGIHYLRTPGNTDKLRADLAGATRAVIVGGSFIGTEVAASLTRLGIACTVVMQEGLPMERAFGRTAGTFVAGLLRGHGVELVPGADVREFVGEERVAGVQLASGDRLDADVVVIGAGAVPDVLLARKSGLALGETGGIACDERLRTSAEGIYAAGDACEYVSTLHDGRSVRIEHEEHAMAQGRTAARNIAGQDVVHDVVPYFWSDLADWATLEAVGAASGWDQELVVGDPAVGAFTVFYATAGRIVGATTVGRTDDLDVARELLTARGTVEDLRGRGIVAAAA